MEFHFAVIFLFPLPGPLQPTWVGESSLSKRETDYNINLTEIRLNYVINLLNTLIHPVN